MPWSICGPETRKHLRLHAAQGDENLVQLRERLDHRIRRPRAGSVESFLRGIELVQYRLEFEPDAMAFFGTYLEVTPHSRLVWTNEEGGSRSDFRSTVVRFLMGVVSLSLFASIDLLLAF
jgi:hypothetical protein